MDRTLLLVDDEENIARALVRVLRRDGYTILTANSGPEGLEILDNNKVDVIVSDQRMPEMSGVEFLGRVKEKYPDTIRIVLSGYTDLNSVTDAINRGAIYKFLTKPWDDELIRENIKKAFAQHELEQENRRLTRELGEANEILRMNNVYLESNIKETAHSLKINLTALKVAQEVLERIPVAVMGMDENGLIVIANKRAHEVFNRNDGELLGGLGVDMLPDDLLGMSAKVAEMGSIQKLSEVGEGKTVTAYCISLNEQCPGRGSILVLMEQDMQQVAGF